MADWYKCGSYVDDIVIKSAKGNDLLADLAETFQSLRAYNIKLNPERCIFGVPGGKLLGFMVSERGIEANPEKIAAIQNMNNQGALRRPEVNRVPRCTQSVHFQTRREGLATLPSDEKNLRTSFGQMRPKQLLKI